MLSGSKGCWGECTIWAVFRLQVLEGGGAITVSSAGFVGMHGLSMCKSVTRTSFLRCT